MSSFFRPGFSRRRLLSCLTAAVAAPEIVFGQAVDRVPSAAGQGTAATDFAPVVAGSTLRFPQDEGSHPAFRLEWWYVTGWLTRSGGSPVGFQITFFRVRPSRQPDNPSSFSPRHILIAHAALADPAVGHLQHDQRAARAAFDLAGAAEGRTDVWIDDWSLRQQNGRYVAVIGARTFRLELSFAATQPPMLQGAAGFSRKGPRPDSASYYYSLPHLATRGTITRNGKPEAVSGVAWLDHEWSSSYLDERAAGWDWVGVNLDDGGAFMAFRMRDATGGRFWASGTYRSAAGAQQTYTPDGIRFAPMRHWRSSRTGVSYPVSWRVRADASELEIDPLFDDQENDTRATTGTIYWEGAVRALRAGTPVGRGYLELTGYWRRLKL
jgi:predicted secreted hydrolase